MLPPHLPFTSKVIRTLARRRLVTPAKPGVAVRQGTMVAVRKLRTPLKPALRVVRVPELEA